MTIHPARSVLQYRLKANRPGGFTEEQLAVEVRVRAGERLLVRRWVHHSGEVLQQQPDPNKRQAWPGVCGRRCPTFNTPPSGSRSMVQVMEDIEAAGQLEAAAEAIHAFVARS